MFDSVGSLLSIVSSPESPHGFILKSNITGEIFNPGPDDTRIFIGDTPGSNEIAKPIPGFQYSPKYSKEIHPCKTCGRVVTSIMLVGSQQKVTRACVCGAVW